MRLNSAIKDTILNRTNFFEFFFFPVFFGVCELYCYAIKNAIKKMFASRIIAFYICTRILQEFFEVTPRKPFGSEEHKQVWFFSR